MLAYPDLVGVEIIKAPVWIRNRVFANLFPDTDERTLGRAIAVGPQVHLAGIVMGITPIGPTGEQRGFRPPPRVPQSCRVAGEGCNQILSAVAA